MFAVAFLRSAGASSKLTCGPLVVLVGSVVVLVGAVGGVMTVGVVAGTLIWSVEEALVLALLEFPLNKLKKRMIISRVRTPNGRIINGCFLSCLVSALIL